MSILENINLRMSVDTRQVDRQFNDATRTVTRGLDAMTLGAEAFEAKWADITDNIRSVKRVASGIAISAAIYGVTAALTSASAAVLTFSNNLDEARISMEYFAEDTLQAQQYIRELEEFAAYTPFNTESAISMAKYLQAMSVPMESSKAVLTVISDTAAATGASEENMQRIVTAMGQVLTKGKLASEEVRQLANANIPIYNILKEELNLTGKEIKDLGNQNIEGSKAVVAILDGLQKRYEGASAKIAETMGGMVETIKDDALIISSSFFTGAIDGIEEKLRSVRDTLDEWREIAMHEGTGGMIEHILGDIDPSGELEQLVMDGIAGFKNLSATIREFATEDGALLKTFGATVYSSIMSVVIAADYLLRGINVVKDGADKLLSVVNNLAGTSLTLTDVVAGLLVFRTVGNTLQFAANTAMWMSKGVLTIGTSIASIVPGVAGASAVVQGFAASIASIGAAALIAYGGIKLMNAITGISDDSTLVTDAYKEAYKAADDTLSAYSEGLNASYDALTDGAFEAFADIEKKSKKSAKKVQKTWLMSFDEVFQIREDPDSDLEAFAAVDWGKYFSLPIFRFPERVAEGVEEAIWKADEAIEAASSSLAGITAMLPLVIGGLSLVGTALRNRTAKIAQLQSEGKLREEDYTLKQQLSKFKDALDKFSKNDDALLKLTEQYKALDNLDVIRKEIVTARDAISEKLDYARALYTLDPTADNKVVVDTLQAQYDKLNKMYDFLDLQAKKRNVLAENIEIKQSQTLAELKKLKEQRAKVGSNTIIDAKGLGEADNVVSIRKINTQLESLDKLSSEAIGVEAEISQKITKLRTLSQSDEFKDIADNIMVLKKKLTTANNRVEAEAIQRQIESLEAKATDLFNKYAAPINLEVQGLQRTLSEKLTGIDKGINNAKDSITKHLQAFKGTNGIDMDVYDRILKNRLSSITEGQSRTIEAITRASKDMSTSELDTISREITLTNDAITRLSASGLPEVTNALVEVEKTNKTINDWLKMQKKYTDLSNEIDLLQAGKSNPTGAVNLSYIDQQIDALKSKRLGVSERLTIAENNLYNIDDVFKEVSSTKGYLRDTLKQINTFKSNLSANSITLNRTASIAAETRDFLKSGVIEASSRRYAVLSDLLDNVYDTVEALPDYNPYKSMMKQLLSTTEEALTGSHSATAVDDALTSFRKEFENYVINTVNTAQDRARVKVAEISARNPMLAATELGTLAVEIDDKAFGARLIDVNADTYKAAIKNATTLDNVARELRTFGAKFDDLETKNLFNQLATTLESITDDTLVTELNKVLDTPAYASSINNPAVARFIRQTLGNANNPLDVDTLNKTLHNILTEERAIKQAAEASKTSREAYKTAVNKIADIVDDASVNLDAAAVKYAQAIENSIFENAAQVRNIVIAAEDITKWFEAGEEAYNAAKITGELTHGAIARLEAASSALTPTSWTPPEYDSIKWMYDNLEDARKLQQDALDVVYEIQDTADAEITKISSEFSEWRKAQNDSSIKALKSVDESMSTITKKVDALSSEIIGDLRKANTVITQIQKDAWDKYVSSYPVQNIPGGFYKATGMTSIEDFNSGRADYAYRYLSDAMQNGNEFALGKAASRQGFNDYGITRQGNNIYDALKALVKNGTDEVAMTTESAIARGYAKAINVRTRSILENTFGAIYRGGTGADATGRVAATVDGLFNIADDTYTLVNRTMVHEQKVLTSKVDDILEQAKLAKSFITTNTGEQIAKIPFKQFVDEFGLIAEDIVNRVGANLSTTKAAGTYLSFTDANNIFKTRPELKIDVIPSEYKKSVEAVEEYVRNKTASTITQLTSGKVTDSLYSENMKGFMIVPDEALDAFKAKLYDNAAALESSVYSYRTARILIGGGAEKVTEMANGLNKSIGIATARFDNISEVANNLPKVAASTDTLGFNEYIKRLLSSATSSNQQKVVNKTLRDILDNINKAIIDGKSLSDSGFATVGTKSFSYLLEGDDILKQARTEVSAAISAISSKVSNTTIAFNDLLRAFEQGTVPVAEVSEKFNMLISEAKYLEDTFGMLNHSISSELLDISKQGIGGIASFKGLSTNPFRILSGQEAVGKMVNDILAQSGESLEDFISDASDTAKKYITESVETFRTKTLTEASRFPLATEANASVNTIRVPTTTAEKLEVNEIAAGKLTAEEARDLALKGQTQTERVITQTRDTLRDVTDPLHFTQGDIGATEAAAWNNQYSVTDALKNSNVKVEANVARADVETLTDGVAKPVSEATKAVSEATNTATEAVARAADALDTANDINVISLRAVNRSLDFMSFTELQNALTSTGLNGATVDRVAQDIFKGLQNINAADYAASTGQSKIFNPSTYNFAAFLDSDNMFSAQRLLDEIGYYTPQGSVLKALAGDAVNASSPLFKKIADGSVTLFKNMQTTFGNAADAIMNGFSAIKNIPDNIYNWFTRTDDYVFNPGVAEGEYLGKAADSTADAAAAAEDALQATARLADLDPFTRLVMLSEEALSKSTAEMSAEMVDSIKAFRELVSTEVASPEEVYKLMQNGGEGLGKVEQLIREQAKNAWGKEYEDMAKAAGLIDAPVSSGSKFVDTINGIMRTPVGKSLLSELTIGDIGTGVGAFDIADSIRQYFDARSEGIDAFNEVSDKLAKQTGYFIEPLADTAGNLVTFNEGLKTASRNLVVEGVATGLAINATNGIATGALGLTGGAAAGVSLLAAIPLVLASLAYMYGTGAYDIENIASGTFAKTLNDQTWAYDQAYAATKDEKVAKDVQLQAQRIYYLDYYKKMNPIWSADAIESIADLTVGNRLSNEAQQQKALEYSSSEGPAPVSPETSLSKARELYGNTYSLAYAVDELTGNIDGLQDIVAENGILYRASTGEVLGDQYNTAKLEEFLYAAYTSGVPAYAESYANPDKLTDLKRTFLGKGVDNMAEQYNELMHDIDAITKARIDDMYALEKQAAEFIFSNNAAEVEAMLEAYGLAYGDMVSQIQGVISIFKGTLQMTADLLSAKAQVINSGDYDVITTDLLLSNKSGSVNRLLDFDTTAIDQTYLDALSSATGIYLQSMSDTMTALTLDVDKVRESITGFTFTMPDSIKLGTETLSIKAIGADASNVEVLAGMGVQINADGTITIDNVAQNLNQSGYTREMEISGTSISEYEQKALESIGVALNDTNNDGTTTIHLDEEKMRHAIEGLTYTLAGVDATSIPLSVVEKLRVAGINISQNEETGEMSATISNAGFIAGNKSIEDILKSVDTSRISEDLRSSLESIDAIVEYYKNKGESNISSANGVVLNTGFKSGDYSKALDTGLQEAGGTLQAALDENGEAAIYLALNKVSEDWSKAITAWEADDISPELKAFLDEVGATVTEAGEYTIVDTSTILANLAGENGKYLTELLFDDAELWESFPEEVQNIFIEAGYATKDGFITLTGEALSGWKTLDDMIAKSWQALDQDTVEAFMSLQGTTLLSWDELTYTQKAKLAELGITTEEQYNQNSTALKTTVGNAFGLLREDTILAWDDLSETTKNNLSAMGISTEAQYTAYLNSLNVKTGQGLSTVNSTTAGQLLSIGATTASGWLGVKKVTDETLSETEARALGYMRFEDLPETIQAALAQGKEGSAYEALHDGWYALATDADTQLGNLDTVVGEQLDNVINTATEKVAKLRELISSPEMQAEAYMANLNSLAASNLKAAKKGSNSYANGGYSFNYSNGGYYYDGTGASQWKSWSDDITIGKQFVAFDNDGGAYYFYNMYLDGQYYGQIAQSAQTGVRKKWLNEGGTPEYDENSDIPAFKLGGLITGDGLFRAGEFGMNEAVLPLEQPAAMARVGQALAAAIPAYQLVAPLVGALGMKDGGVAQFSQYQRQESMTQPIEEIINSVLSAQAHKAPQPNSSDSSMRPLYVGTLIADKSGLRELNRKMKLVEKQDGGR